MLFSQENEFTINERIFKNETITKETWIFFGKYENQID